MMARSLPEGDPYGRRRQYALVSILPLALAVGGAQTRAAEWPCLHFLPMATRGSLQPLAIYQGGDRAGSRGL